LGDSVGFIHRLSGCGRCSRERQAHRARTLESLSARRRAACADEAALAHELGHVDLDHRDDRPKHEVMADGYAAEHMIDPDRLVDLMCRSSDPSRWALEMGVSTRLIRIYWNLHREGLRGVA
jgi:hypothetical protein